MSDDQELVRVSAKVIGSGELGPEGTVYTELEGIFNVEHLVGKSFNCVKIIVGGIGIAYSPWIMPPVKIYKDTRTVTIKQKVL